MSSTSTVTALMVGNHISDDKVELLNCMCVLVLTRGNGTPFSVTSIQEEDIIELCVEMGQTHPKGVLQCLVIELVVLFHSTEKMLVTVHGVTNAMHFV